MSKKQTKTSKTQSLLVFCIIGVRVINKIIEEVKHDMVSP